MATELTQHFTLEELYKSDVAARCGINNMPTPSAIENLRHVALNILEPVRAHFGRPFRPTSGYRCEKLNEYVKGSERSQHMTGEAVDFEVPGVANGDLAAWMRDNLEFDQLILELYTPGQPTSGWVHCSLKREGKKRRDVLTLVGGGGGFRPGLIV